MTVYQYDSLGRNTAEIWYADATDADADQDRLATITYAYDAAGRMLTAEDAESAEYEYVYDDLGRLAEETQGRKRGHPYLPVQQDVVESPIMVAMTCARLEGSLKFFQKCYWVLFMAGQTVLTYS